MDIKLLPLEKEDQTQFILDNQWAFKYGALIEFGQRDDHLDEAGEIISYETIYDSIHREGNQTYRILCDNQVVGGVILSIDEKTKHNELEILFILPEAHGKGIGQAAWKAIEAMYPETEVWETFTPYFEKRNIHFYVNKCGFQIVEFFNEFHMGEVEQIPNDEGPDEMFRMMKVMKK